MTRNNLSSAIVITRDLAIVGALVRDAKNLAIFTLSYVGDEGFRVQTGLKVFGKVPEKMPN